MVGIKIKSFMSENAAALIIFFVAVLASVAMYAYSESYNDEFIYEPVYEYQRLVIFPGEIEEELVEEVYVIPKDA